MPNGDIYFHRYNHDSYGESNGDCTGWPSNPNAANRYGRFCPVLSGERGEYEIANGRSPNVYLQSMADSANDGYFLPEQVWDRADVACFTAGRPTGSAAPLNWAEGQYLRLASQSRLVMIWTRRRSSRRNIGTRTPSAPPLAIVSIQIFTCNGTAAQSWASKRSNQSRVDCFDQRAGGLVMQTLWVVVSADGQGLYQWFLPSVEPPPLSASFLSRPSRQVSLPLSAL